MVFGFRGLGFRGFRAFGFRVHRGLGFRGFGPPEVLCCPGTSTRRSDTVERPSVCVWACGRFRFRAQGLDGVPPLRLEFHLPEVQVVLGMADRFCR